MSITGHQWGAAHHSYSKAQGVAAASFLNVDVCTIIESFTLEVTHISLAHSSLARTIHVAPINYKGAKKCNSIMCLERR